MPRASAARFRSARDEMDRDEMDHDEIDLELWSAIPPWEWTEEVAQRLIEVLRDDAAPEEERLLAAQMAGESAVVDDEIVDALLSVVEDANAAEELRGRAAIALGPTLEEADVEGFDGLGEPPISEQSFQQIQRSLRRVYDDHAAPKIVRRRVLEASVRAPQSWHHDAVDAAYASDDPLWKLTAVFSMRWVDGFDEQILEALDSDDEQIRYEAVCAAGDAELEAAWPRIEELLTSEGTERGLLLAAIEAAAGVRPEEAESLLIELIDSEDEDIAETAHEALAAMGSFVQPIDDDDDDYGL